MDIVKTIGLVAHDNMKVELIDWVDQNWEKIKNHRLICTGTTGKLVEAAIKAKILASQNEMELNITKLKSGPLGGDQQLGSLISEGKIDILIFFWDPMLPQPHEVDVKALLRICVVYNIPSASNRATADFLITSPLFHNCYIPTIKDYSTYVNRKV